MSLIQDYIRPNLYSISVAMIATLLVIYGNDINRGVKRLVRKYPFALRVFIFVLVCAFGYGYITLILARIVRNGLAQLNNLELILCILAAFFTLGFLAEHKKHL